jgi:hypothetical protein
MTTASTASQRATVTNHHAQRSAVLGQQPKVVVEMMPTTVNRVATQLRTLITMPTSVSRIALLGLLQMKSKTVLPALITNLQTMQRTNVSKRAELGSQETLLRKTVSSVVATLRTLITAPTSVSLSVRLDK